MWWLRSPKPTAYECGAQDKEMGPCGAPFQFLGLVRGGPERNNERKDYR